MTDNVIHPGTCATLGIPTGSIAECLFMPRNGDPRYKLSYRLAGTHPESVKSVCAINMATVEYLSSGAREQLFRQGDAPEPHRVPAPIGEMMGMGPTARVIESLPALGGIEVRYLESERDAQVRSKLVAFEVLAEVHHNDLRLFAPREKAYPGYGDFASYVARQAKGRPARVVPPSKQADDRPARVAPLSKDALDEAVIGPFPEEELVGVPMGEAAQKLFGLPPMTRLVKVEQERFGVAICHYVPQRGRGVHGYMPQWLHVGRLALSKLSWEDRQPYLPNPDPEVMTSLKPKEEEPPPGPLAKARTYQDLPDVNGLSSEAHFCLGLLDDISTAGDVAKGDDAKFRWLVEGILSRRSELPVESDGHSFRKVGHPAERWASPERKLELLLERARVVSPDLAEDDTEDYDVIAFSIGRVPDDVLEWIGRAQALLSDKFIRGRERQRHQLLADPWNDTSSWKKGWRSRGPFNPKRRISRIKPSKDRS